MKILKTIRNTIIILLQLVIIPALLLVFYIALIYFTNGYGNGLIAAVLTTFLAILLLYILFKRGWASNKFKFAGLFLPVILSLAFIIYTLIPVASSGKINKVPGPAHVTTKYWNLDTGSRIAYYKLPAKIGTVKKTTPIIFLHGGPGAYVRQRDIDFFSMFTDDGYDVYLYDQAGGGRSDLLPKALYSHQRNIHDFEAIINIINAKQYIVVGQSYGGTLLAHIAATEKLSKRIAKAIYAEPGVSVASKSEDNKVFAKSPHASPGDVSLPVRLLISILICPKGEFTSQNETINYLLDNKPLIQGLFKESYPKKDTAIIPTVDISVINFAANSAIKLDAVRPADDLAINYKRYKVPSMLMLGESSYIERNAPMDLLLINPNIKSVQYVQGVGHILWNGLYSNNKRVKKIMDQFLNNQNTDVPNYPDKNTIEAFLKQRL